MKALLSYLPCKQNNKPDYELFGNQLYANYLPRVLKEMGYTVDYIDWQDKWFKSSRHYDLFIGHGGYNFTKYAPRANTAIYFSTGFYWREFNRLEQERFDALYQRRGVRLQPDRQITTDEESALRMADGIITLGNDVTAASYGDFQNVYAIGGMTAQRGQDLTQKDYEAGRKHFLFYSGDGAVHKGLDLLIEAFAGTDLHLHICHKVEPQLFEIYKNEIRDNIHYYGWIDIHSDKFKAFVSVFDWVISATCCEGCPSAILECMAHGLIPILTENASININGNGYYIKNHIGNINWLVGMMNSRDAKEIASMSQAAQAQAKIYYSPAAFSLRLKEAIEAIV